MLNNYRVRQLKTLRHVASLTESRLTAETQPDRLPEVTEEIREGDTCMWRLRLHPSTELMFSIQIPAQKAYTIEKIEPSVFSSESSLNVLLQDMEELFAARFSTSLDPHVYPSCC